MSSLIRHVHRKTYTVEGQRHGALDMAKSRSSVIIFFFLLSYGLVGARVFDLTYITPMLRAHSGQSEIISENTNTAPIVLRGNIYDRNGTLLATNIRTTQLYIDPFFIENKEEVAKGLAKAFKDERYDALLKKANSKSRFEVIREELTPQEQRAVLDLGFPGLFFKDGFKRVYPQGKLLSHVIGFAGKDSTGLEGSERFYEKTLKNGDDINLALDVRVQHILREALLEKKEAFQAKLAAGLVMDIHTGEIIAASSLPDYDPNVFEKSAVSERYDPLLKGVYEMGSTFKIFSTAALLEEHQVPFSKTYDASEPLIRGKFKIHDYHGEKRVLTIPEIFMHSSNIGSGLMGEDLGAQTLQAFYRDLGLLDRVVMDGVVTAQPLVPKPWREISTITASYGHGIAVSPMHIAQAVASIVNDGIKVSPKLLKQGNGESLSQMRVVSEDTAHKMRQLMRLVVKEGTGANAEVLGYGVGGKTGTAEKIDANGRYSKKNLLSSFVGVFPSNAPRYLVFAMFDEPIGNKESYGYATAGWTAAPAVADVVKKMSKVMGIAASYSEIEDAMMMRNVSEFIAEEEEVKKVQTQPQTGKVTLASQ